MGVTWIYTFDFSEVQRVNTPPPPYRAWRHLNNLDVIETTSRYVTLRRAMSRYVMLRHVTSRNVTSRSVTCYCSRTLFIELMPVSESESCSLSWRLFVECRNSALPCMKLYCCVIETIRKENVKFTALYRFYIVLAFDLLIVFNFRLL